eukprot:m.331807 g.331807  ORF g.331807 m.331807 type:complete len:340 (+) comp16797_c0_seq1:89-1108(+)
MSLFGDSGAGNRADTFGGPAPGGVSFHAGKCSFDPDTMMVTPEKELGSINLSKEHGMLNFVWRDRKTGKADEAMTLFPGDGKFLKCKSCPEGSRIYYLCFANAKRDFFWMQSVDPSKDDENMKAVNAAINGETVPTSNDNDSQLAALGINEEQMQVLNALPADERQQMALMLGIQLPPVTPTSAPRSSETPAPSATPSQPPAVRPAGQENAASMLQNIMAGTQTGARLTDILSPQQVAPLLDNEEFVSALTPLLPDGQQSLQGLRENVNSPQYAQALQSLDSALQSGDMAAAMSQFGVDPAVVALGGGGVVGLAHALQQKADEEKDKDVEMKDAEKDAE